MQRGMVNISAVCHLISLLHTTNWLFHPAEALCFHKDIRPLCCGTLQLFKGTQSVRRKKKKKEYLIILLVYYSMLLEGYSVLKQTVPIFANVIYPVGKNNQTSVPAKGLNTAARYPSLPGLWVSLTLETCKQLRLQCLSLGSSFRMI